MWGSVGAGGGRATGGAGSLQPTAAAKVNASDHTPRWRDSWTGGGEMAATGLLALLDDITAIMDDVAALTKVAAKNTAGIAGDDLAVNAHGLVGIDPSRELPIVGRVALGSTLNKFVLVPLALLLPQAVITPLLMGGGAFLCYEGIHKLTHRKHPEETDKLLDAARAGPDDLQAFEAVKIRQAIVTDIILSAEIVAVALGAVAEEPLATKAIVLSVGSLAMTFAIYGLVALIVKLDDIGLYLQRSAGKGTLRYGVGRALVDGTPYLMRLISVGGTIAMFLVGGGILLHGFHGAEEQVHHLITSITMNGTLIWIMELIATLVVGMVAGAVVAGVVEAGKWLWRRIRGTPVASHG